MSGIHDAPSAGTIAEPALSTSSSRDRVLIVEDELAARTLLRVSLALDFDVETVANGEEALRAVLQQRPDLIVTDIVMPGSVDGVELVRILRESPSTSMIPILLMSGRAPEELRIEGFDAGAESYLSKPFTEPDLRARVRAMLASARRRDESARQDQLERAIAERAALLESITDAFYAVDDDWCFTYLNGRALDYFKMTREELLGKRIWDAIPVEFGDELAATLRRVKSERRAGSAEIYSVRTGRWLEIHAYPSGIGLAINFCDITDRKLAEAKLRESGSRFRAIADAVPVLMWQIDIDEQAAWFNATWLAFTASEIEDNLGLGWMRLVHPDDQNEVLKKYRACAQIQAPVEVEFRLRRHDGEYRRMLNRGNPIFDGPRGECSGYVGTCVDVTDIKRSEESARDAERRKDVFVAAVAHELRNPLAPLRYGLQILKREREADEATARILGMMDRQLEHLARLVDDLLDAGRFASGKFSLKRTPTTLAEVLNDAVEAAAPQIEARQHHLTVDIVDQGLTVDGDRTRLAQLVTNLLSNSAKYTDPGGIIKLTLTREQANAVIVVQDNGIGFPPECEAELFKMFAQVRSHETHSEGGLGIGLALVRSIAEMHNGSVEAASEGQGAGSSFTVRLPLIGAQRM